MSVKNFIPEIWSTRLLKPFDKSLVIADVFNRDYEGEIANAGDLVRISGVGPITVSDYAGTVTYEELNDQQTTLAIDKQKYFGFLVNDVDKAQANVNFMDEAMIRAAYAMKDSVDTYLASLYTQAGTTVVTAAYTSDNALAGLLTLGQKLDELNIPTEGRWCIIPPWFRVKLVLAKLLIENTTNDAMDNGRVGRIAGFDLRVSNNLSNNGTTWYIMAGTKAAGSYAGQINKIEALRDKDVFADYVRGLLVYGAKIIQPDALAVLTATWGTE